jgi:hypothetical protein
MKKLLDNWQSSHSWQIVLYFLAGGLVGASNSPAFAPYKPILIALAGMLSGGAVGVGLLSPSASAAVNQASVVATTASSLVKELTAKKVNVPPLPLLLLSISLTALPVGVFLSMSTACNSPIVAPSEQLGECILEVGLSDLVDAVSDPLTIIPIVYAACKSYGEATASVIWNVLENYLGIAPVLADSGVPALTDGGAPTAFLSAVQKARLLKVHDAARATITATTGDGGK